jgi:hypothetical protein
LLLSTTVNCGRKIRYPAEIEFDYVDQSGDLRITGLLTMRGNQKNADSLRTRPADLVREFDICARDSPPAWSSVLPG